ncbi:MAG: hypothetical protein ACRELT_14405, partial [Longimicrobiales bacterium]
GLGAAHGVNPAMGWLFAVALGLQERSRRAVWRALGPLALGHALAIAAVVLFAAALGLVIPLAPLRWIVAAALIGFGMVHLTRHRHPRGAGMRVGAKDLTIWSFLMATAHGAGLMTLPLVLAATSPGATGAAHGHGSAAPLADPAGHLLAASLSGASVGLTASVIHTAGYLAVTGVLAVVVYEKLGLGILRRVWVNVNLIWAAALIVAGLVTPWL